MAHKRADIVINFKVDSNLSEGIHCYEDMIPSSIKLDIVDKYYKIGNKTNQNNKLIVYQSSSIPTVITERRIDPLVKYLIHVFVIMI